MLSSCFLDFSVGVGAFVIGLSQISSFFSHEKLKHIHTQLSEKIISFYFITKLYFLIVFAKLNIFAYVYGPIV